MMFKIIIATGNKDKMREAREILGGMDVEILSMREAGIEADIVEDGTTFEENAVIKARAVAEVAYGSMQTEKDANASAVVREDDATRESDIVRADGDSRKKGMDGMSSSAGESMASCVGAVILADDSGLEIDALNKEPGIYSARYMGEDTPYTAKNQALLDRLNGVPTERRTARFVCAIAAVLPDGEVLTVRETVEGRIGEMPAGENGFGYDPIFRPDGYDCAMAELPDDEKNKISHRGKALRSMRDMLLERGF